MTCEYRGYDEMACGYICENPLNTETELHEKVCYNEDECMVNYQQNPLLEVQDILNKHIIHYEKQRTEGIVADVIYIALTNLERDLSHLWERDE